MHPIHLNIGIIVSALGYDGVSHEAFKKRLVLQGMGHNVFIITGNKGRHVQDWIIELPSIQFDAEAHTYFEFLSFPNLENSLNSYQLPELKEVSIPLQKEIKENKLNKESTSKILNGCMNYFAIPLEKRIHTVIKDYEIDLLIVENLFAIPVQIPLTIAIAKLIEKHKIPTIAVHHDFYWERQKFKESIVPNILETYFPFTGDQIKHVVINTLAQKALKDPGSIDYDVRPKEPVESVIMPNVFNFDFAPSETSYTLSDMPVSARLDHYNSDFRQELGFNEDDILLLQHTRLVERKNIERSVDLLIKLKEKRPEKANKYKLVISTSPIFEEGEAYYKKLKTYIEEKGLEIGECDETRNVMGDVVFIGARLSSVRYQTKKGKKIYHYLDPYHHCDISVYPSYYEGWGNTIGETVQAKKPLLINKYSIYVSDIKPLGFDFIEIDDEITSEVVDKVLEVLENAKLRQAMVDKNFQIGKEKINFHLVEQVFNPLFQDLLGYVLENKEINK